MNQALSSSSNGLEKRPALRFPGFDEPYRTTPLGEIASLVNRTDPKSNAPIMMLSAGNGFIMQSEKYSRDNAGQSLKKYILLKQGELAYNHGASKAKQFGCCYELTEPEARIPYVYHCFKINEDEYTPYVAMALNNAKMDQQLKRLVSSSVRMDGLLNISFEDYMSVTLHLPSFIEQKHIADFLKKLDERITAQERLVTYLKKYKRGLLEQIFSDISKSYHSSKLRDLVHVSGGKTPSMNNSLYWNGSIVWISSKDMKSNRIYDSELKITTLALKEMTLYHPGTLLLVARSGILKHTLPLSVLEVEATINQDIKALQVHGCNSRYLYYAILAQEDSVIRTHVKTGTTVQSLMMDSFMDIEIPVPDIEQQQTIASKLSKIEQYVEGQTKSLSGLMQMRAGLLQQLFI